MTTGRKRMELCCFCAVYSLKFIEGSRYVNWLPSSVDLQLNKTERRWVTHTQQYISFCASTLVTELLYRFISVTALSLCVHCFIDMAICDRTRYNRSSFPLNEVISTVGTAMLFILKWREIVVFYKDTTCIQGVIILTGDFELILN